MITYADMDRKTGLRFTMVFADGDTKEDCLDSNPDITDEDLIAACNKTNPVRWGKVVAIADRKVSDYWQLRKDF